MNKNKTKKERKKPKKTKIVNPSIVGYMKQIKDGVRGS